MSGFVCHIALVNTAEFFSTPPTKWLSCAGAEKVRLEGHCSRWDPESHVRRFPGLGRRSFSADGLPLDEVEVGDVGEIRKNVYFKCSCGSMLCGT